METILNAPYILRVLLSLFIILAVNKWIKQLWAAVILGTLLLALWCGHSPAAMAEISWQKISSLNTIFLAIAVFQIIWLSSQMSETGVMKDLVESVKNRISRRASMALLPALIGLLPMPGGAIFSAPLVDECDEDNTVEPLLKTKINYWFRHVWEYWWPLYPGVLLTVDLTGLSILTVMILQLPLSIVSIGAGYFFLLRKVASNKTGSDTNKSGNNSRFLLLITPIIIIIATYGLLRLVFPFMGEFNKYIPMCIGILMAQLFLQLYRPLPLGTWKKIFCFIWQC
jgi:integral membrane protein (TIGR00529 family)